VHFDLNLLRTLDALLEEGSVTGAADRLHLSPPAMSRALGRLRRVTGDEILVRTGRTMTPTPRALAMRAEVHAVLDQAQQILAPVRSLDLAALDRTFTLRCHDALAATVIGPVVESARTQAPGVRLRFLAESSADTDELRRGHVELEVSAGPAAGEDVRSEVAGHDALAVLAAPGHPFARGTGDLAAYLGAEHLSVSRRGRLRDAVDDALAARGLSRRVPVAVPTALAAVELVSRGDLLGTAPARTVGPLARRWGLQVLPLPVEVPAVPLVLSWPRRYDGDRAHAWLREQVRRALADPTRPTAALR